MRLSLLKFAAALLVAAGFTSAARAGISGSAHDFGSQSWSGNQICQPCHAPHNAQPKDANGVLLQGPLWNHQLSNTQTYTLYASYNAIAIDGTTGKGVVDPATGKLAATTGTLTPDQNSKLCLSCHDGTVALDSFGGNSGTQFITNSKKVFGTDLSNDHPIGDAAIYPTNDGKVSSASYMVDPQLRTAKGIMPLRLMADGRLAVGCTSCHEPHNRKSTQYMLWVNNSGSATLVDGTTTVSGSALCLNCHKK
jgi:hypothetical protein